MYYIVLFTEEDVVEVVPSSWLVGLNKCKWPTTSKSWPSIKISKHVRERMDPEDDFSSYNIQILGSAETYLRACQKREKATFTDDINTTENDKTSKQNRNIMKRHRLYESSDSDSDEDETPERNKLIGISTLPNHGKRIKCPPKAPVLQQQQLVGAFQASSHMQISSIQQDESSPSTSFQSPADLVVSRERTPKSTAEGNITVKELLCLNATYNKKILKTLEELKQDIKDLKIKQQQKWAHADPDPIEQVNIPVSLPLDNEESLTTLELFLISPKNKSIMIKKLQCIGGLTESDHIKRTLRFCLKNNVASKYSFHGRHGSKKSFSSLHLKEVIFEGIKKLRPALTEVSFCNTTSDWLRFAPYRTDGNKCKKNADKNVNKE